MIRKKSETQMKFFLFVQWVVGSVSLIGSAILFHEDPISPDHMNIILFVIFVTGGFSMTLVDIFKACDQHQRKNRTHHHG